MIEITGYQTSQVKMEIMPSQLYEAMASIVRSYHSIPKYSWVDVDGNLVVDDGRGSHSSDEFIRKATPQDLHAIQLMKDLWEYLK